MFNLHGKPYHCVIDSFRETFAGNAANNQSRMLTSDNELQINAKRLKLEEEIIIDWGNRIKQDNKWVKKYRSLLELD